MVVCVKWRIVKLIKRQTLSKASSCGVLLFSFWTLDLLIDLLCTEQVYCLFHLSSCAFWVCTFQSLALTIWEQLRRHTQSPLPALPLMPSYLTAIQAKWAYITLYASIYAPREMLALAAKLRASHIITVHLPWRRRVAFTLFCFLLKPTVP